MKCFSGDRTIDGVVVTVDGKRLDPRFDLATYSRDGFEWSYDGAAPRQLAFAILFEHTGDGAKAKALSEPFARTIVANFDNEWELTSADIDATIHALSGHGERTAGGRWSLSRG